MNSIAQLEYTVAVRGLGQRWVPGFARGRVGRPGLDRLASPVGLGATRRAGAEAGHRSGWVRRDREVVVFSERERRAPQEIERLARVNLEPDRPGQSAASAKPSPSGG